MSGVLRATPSIHLHGVDYSTFNPSAPYDPVNTPSVESVGRRTFLVAISDQATLLSETLPEA